ncbi:YkvA family protein [Spirulina sp. CCNP1310]|uniref:YkvA family protein n=1 Tax=Spirulina sp. CCNP1310 TaxID=3110249 RepID=UPI002B21B30E|nr:YkvA family protein [Spirulina sp. CCNP1310]MEA5419338.1 YkvA family protein [Spirulina sp. CCNP1310]
MSISPKAIYDWYRSTLRNPKYRWWIILGSLVYIISPIDIAPDLIPIVGQIDDLMILTLLISEVSQLVLDFAKTKKAEGVSPDLGDNQTATVNVDAVTLD